MKSVQKPIRINPAKERELYEFISKRGTKPAIKFLFDFYQNNKNIVQDIVDKLKDEITFSKQRTTTIVKKKEDDFSDDFIVDDDADSLLSSFIK